MLAEQLQKHAVNWIILQGQFHEDGHFLLLANHQLENPHSSLLAKVALLQSLEHTFDLIGTGRWSGEEYLLEEISRVVRRALSHVPIEKTDYFTLICCILVQVEIDLL